ncbi:MAG: preprotein translocase subunit SecE [Candidatus Gastranaerophilales bacterium]|nr:preprotein translocase subunit SecE [Candidatus Gastranaerophilales bacterium]
MSSNIKEKRETNMIESLQTYFKGVKSEWGRVTWPEKPQVAVETVVVICIVFLFTAGVYLIDIVFKGLFSLVAK